MKGSLRRGRRGLATRLMTAQALVLLVAGVTAWLVAALIGPRIFHAHLDHEGELTRDNLARHAEEAYVSANAVTVSIALLAAVVTAFAVSVYLNRRIGRTVAAASDAASLLAAGSYRTRVPTPRLGPEFEELALAFNTMARRLEETETTRRRLIADVAHEMRTPLATMQGYLEALEDGVAQLDGETLAVLRAQTGRLTRLATDMAAVSKAEEGRIALARDRVAAADIARSAVTAAADSYASGGVRLALDVEEGLPPLRVDADRLAQVLGNLLENSLRHTPRGGAVVVTAEAGSGGQVELAVQDDGEGIAAEHLPHVFERLYRADGARDRQHGGSGIGLAIVKAIVEAHGGHVTASSEGEGTGTRVAVHLPIDDISST